MVQSVVIRGQRRSPSSTLVASAVAASLLLVSCTTILTIPPNMEGLLSCREYAGIPLAREGCKDADFIYYELDCEPGINSPCLIDVPGLRKEELDDGVKQGRFAAWANGPKEIMAGPDGTPEAFHIPFPGVEHNNLRNREMEDVIIKCNDSASCRYVAFHLTGHYGNPWVSVVAVYPRWAADQQTHEAQFAAVGAGQLDPERQLVFLEKGLPRTLVGIAGNNYMNVLLRPGDDGKARVEAVVFDWYNVAPTRAVEGPRAIGFIQEMLDRKQLAEALACAESLAVWPTPGSEAVVARARSVGGAESSLLEQLRKEYPTAAGGRKLELLSLAFDYLEQHNLPKLPVQASFSALSAELDELIKAALAKGMVATAVGYSLAKSRLLRETTQCLGWAQNAVDVNCANLYRAKILYIDLYRALAPRVTVSGGTEFDADITLFGLRGVGWNTQLEDRLAIDANREYGVRLGDDGDLVVEWGSISSDLTSSQRSEVLEYTGESANEAHGEWEKAVAAAREDVVRYEKQKAENASYSTESKQRDVYKCVQVQGYVGGWYQEKWSDCEKVGTELEVGTFDDDKYKRYQQADWGLDSASQRLNDLLSHEPSTTLTSSERCSVVATDYKGTMSRSYVVRMGKKKLLEGTRTVDINTTTKDSPGCSLLKGWTRSAYAMTWLKQWMAARAFDAVQAELREAYKTAFETQLQARVALAKKRLKGNDGIEEAAWIKYLMGQPLDEKEALLIPKGFIELGGKWETVLDK